MELSSGFSPESRRHTIQETTVKSPISMRRYNITCCHAVADGLIRDKYSRVMDSILVERSTVLRPGLSLEIVDGDIVMIKGTRNRHGGITASKIVG